MIAANCDTAVIIQARMKSSRLPGKILLPLAGKPVLLHVVDRCFSVSAVDIICVVIPDNQSSDALEETLKTRPNVLVVRGDENDVLDRFHRAIEFIRPRRVVRITSDCPCLDPVLLSGLLALQCETEYVYVRNSFESGLPHGQDIEVIMAQAVVEASQLAEDPYEREHVTPYIWRRPKDYPSLLVSRRPDLRDLRLTLDTESDYDLLTRLFDALYPSTPNFGLASIMKAIEMDPKLEALCSRELQKHYEGSPDQ